MRESSRQINHGGTDAALRITEDAMSSILNNISALGASRQLGITGAGLNQTIQRLTTGRRINRASDDAAGLGISNKLGADIQIAGQGQRNANDAVSYLQVADGVMDEVTNLLTRASELAQQAQTGTISDSNRVNIDAEFQNIIKTIADIGQKTEFNGASVFSTGATTIAVGGYNAIQITVGSISDSTMSALGMVAGTTSLSTAKGATDAADIIEMAISSVSTVRASLGANMQQLSSVSDSLGIQVQNFTAAKSQIMDANIADEVVNLTKFQILNQSGTSALSKSNQSAQQILALLQ
jgi:flagellin